MSVEMDIGVPYSTIEESDAKLRPIRKLYTIISTQFVIALIFAALPILSEAFRSYAIHHTWFLVFSLGALLTPLILLACFSSQLTYSQNYCLLGILTLGWAFTLMMIGATSRPDIMIYFVLITTVVCIAVFAFTFQTKIDLTVFTGVLLVFITVVIVMGIIMAIVHYDISVKLSVLPIASAALGAFVFNTVLFLDAQTTWCLIGLYRWVKYQ